MKYLIDTHWIISFLNQRPEAVALFDELSDEGIVISTVTIGEVLEGLMALAVDDRRTAEFETLIDSIDVLDIDHAAAVSFAAARLALRRRGQPIPDNDLWIAAAAIAHDLTLVSRDEHFDRVPNLKLRR